jgi:hypothetical protein
MPRIRFDDDSFTLVLTAFSLAIGIAAYGGDFLRLLSWLASP